MKNAISVVLAFVIIFSVLYVIPNEMVFDVKYMARVLARVGSYSPPTLTGGYSFDSFAEGSLAATYLLSYPLRLAFYLVAQTVRFFSYTFGFTDIVSPIVPDKGFGGGIYT